MDSFIDLAVARYSVRSYDKAPVEQEKIDRLLEVVRIAPTARNLQPQRLLVVTDPERLALIDRCTPCRYRAPLVFIVCYDTDVCWVRSFDNESSGAVDASIVTTHLMLEASSIGLGSVWVMNFDATRIRKLFDLPENIVPVALLPVGYPASDVKPSPHHEESLDLSELLLS